MNTATPEIIWKNDQDGNNHSLVFADRTLKLTVQKPDGTRWESFAQGTKSTLQEWQQAFAGLGSKWNQVPEEEHNDGEGYMDMRFAETATERASWSVHHITEGTRYKIDDSFSVIHK